MPKARSPVIAVVSYFQSAPLESAELTLAIVKHVVAARQDGAVATPSAKKAKLTTPSAPRKERADKGKPRGPKNETEGVPGLSYVP